MYDREYGGRELHFEASGGLLHASLVMQDRETDSYWSIMTGDALAGDFAGTPLAELTVGEKAQWKDWVARHPDSLVLSVDGEEHDTVDPYASYFTSDESFRGGEAADPRLPTKEPIYAFESGGRAFAVPHGAFEGGKGFDAGGVTIWLYRPRGVAVFYSTRAFRSPQGGDFVENAHGWRHLPSGARYDRELGTFSAAPGAPVPLDGFDTFWFNWSMTHPQTAVLGAGKPVPEESRRD